MPNIINACLKCKKLSLEFKRSAGISLWIITTPAFVHGELVTSQNVQTQGDTVHSYLGSTGVAGCTLGVISSSCLCASDLLRPDRNEEPQLRSAEAPTERSFEAAVVTPDRSSYESPYVQNKSHYKHPREPGEKRRSNG